MNTIQIFPARFWANDSTNWVTNPAPAMSIWERIRPRGMSWYAVDYEIVNADCIRLFAYKIADSAGGIGEKIYETEVTEFTASERAELNRKIENLKWAAAELELERRDNLKRQASIKAIKEALFG